MSDGGLRSLREALAAILDKLTGVEKGARMPDDPIVTESEPQPQPVTRSVDEGEFTPYGTPVVINPTERSRAEGRVHGEDDTPKRDRQQKPEALAPTTVTAGATTVQGFVISRAPDTFQWNGQIPKNKTLPFPHTLIAPSDRGSATMRSWTGWVTTGFNHARHALFRPVPILQLTDTGTPVVSQAYYQRGNSSEEALTEDHVNLLHEQAGGRNNSLILPYCTGREIPGQPGLSMIMSLSGWMAHLDLSGRIWDAGGYRTPEGVMPRAGGKSKVWHGIYDTPFNGPNDFAFHPHDAHRAFVCDTYNDRLTLLIGNRPPEWRTAVQFPKGTWPYSCEFLGEDLYVCLRGNVPAGNRVVKVSGLLKDSGTPTVTDAFTGLSGPQCIRRYPGGEFRVATVDDMWVHALAPLMNNAKKALYRITTDNGSPSVTGKWVWLYIDLTGSQGPVGDTFLMISGTSFTALRRIYETETGIVSNWMKGNGALMSGSTPYVSQDPYGHYGWAIWGSESGLPILWHNGFGSMGIHASFYKPNAPRTWDSSYFLKGRGHWEASVAPDTVTGSPGRASIALLHGNKGYTLLGGDVKTIEELYLMPWTEFATYMRGGAGGKYPRAWFTDDDLRAIRYFAKCSGPYALSSLTVDAVGTTPASIYPPSAPYRVSVPPVVEGTTVVVKWEAAEADPGTLKQYIVVIDGTREQMVPASSLMTTVTGLTSGLHTIAVYSENMQGRRSITSRVSTVEARAAGPLPATDLSVSITGADVSINWMPSNSATAAKQELWYEGRKLTDLTMADATYIHQLPGKIATYMIKTVDDQGRASEAQVSAILPDVD